MLFSSAHKIEFKKKLFVLFLVSAKVPLQGALQTDIKTLKSKLTELK
jgi:hypothetical protein